MIFRLSSMSYSDEMGQSVTIACSSRWELANFEEFLKPELYEEPAVLSAFPGQVQLVASGMWTIVVNQVAAPADAAEEYASNEDLDIQFRHAVRALRFFVVRFSDINPTRILLREFARAATTQHESAWLDTDYGWVISVDDFLHRLAENSTWDWRIKQ